MRLSGVILLTEPSMPRASRICWLTGIDFKVRSQTPPPSEMRDES